MVAALLHHNACNSSNAMHAAVQHWSPFPVHNAQASMHVCTAGSTNDLAHSGAGRSDGPSADRGEDIDPSASYNASEAPSILHPCCRCTASVIVPKSGV